MLLRGEVFFSLVVGCGWEEEVGILAVGLGGLVLSGGLMLEFSGLRGDHGPWLYPRCLTLMVGRREGRWNASVADGL